MTVAVAEATVTVAVAGAGAVGRGDLRSPMWPGPGRNQGWVRRQRMARMESSRASAGVTVAWSTSPQAMATARRSRRRCGVVKPILARAPGPFGDVARHRGAGAFELQGQIPVVKADALDRRPESVNHLQSHFVDLETFHQDLLCRGLKQAVVRV